MREYREEHPLAAESKQDYARRLESEGHDEMFIRKGLRQHFSMELKELGDFCEEFEIARLRHLAEVAKLHAYPDEKAFVLKVSKNLGISVDRAEQWVKRFKLADPVD